MFTFVWYYCANYYKFGIYNTMTDNKCLPCIVISFYILCCYILCMIHTMLIYSTFLLFSIRVHSCFYKTCYHNIYYITNNYVIKAVTSHNCFVLYSDKNKEEHLFLCIPISLMHIITRLQQYEYNERENYLFAT